MMWVLLLIAGFVLGSAAGILALGLFTAKTVSEYEEIIEALLKRIGHNHKKSSTIIHTSKVGNYCRGKQIEKQKI